MEAGKISDRNNDLTVWVFLLAQKRLEWKLEKYRIEIMT